MSPKATHGLVLSGLSQTMASTHFLKLEDLLAPAPLPALVAPLMVVGLVTIAVFVRRMIAREEGKPIDIAASFVLVTGVIAATIHSLALAGAAYIPVLRVAGVGFALLGLVALPRGLRVVTLEVGNFLRVTRKVPWSKPAIVVLGTTLLGLAASVLGPATDADSIVYHLGVPLDWLRHHGAVPQPNWMLSRLVGIGESLNMLGLASGTDCFGATLQFSGLIVAAVALESLSTEPRDRLLAWLLVVTCPVMIFLTPNQKPQLLPSAALVLAVVLLVTRFSVLKISEATVVSGLIAFAAASKLSFLLSAAVIAVALLFAALKRGHFASTVIILTGVSALALAPILYRNWGFFGDPMSPFLERFRATPDPAVVTFAKFLRVAGIVPTTRNLLTLPWSITATAHPGQYSTVLGLGVLAIVPAFKSRGVARLALLLAGATALMTLFLGQLAGRFFLDAYLWLGAAAIAASSTPSKEILRRVLTAQGVASGLVAVVGAATLFPGALTAALRTEVMTKRACGYSEATWLDQVLPANAVIALGERYNALWPRRFLPADSVIYDARHADSRLAELVQQGANVIVVKTRYDSAFRRLAERCGTPISDSHRFTIATRNAFNATRTDEVRPYSLDRCLPPAQTAPKATSDN